MANRELVAFFMWCEKYPLEVTNMAQYTQVPNIYSYIVEAQEAPQIRDIIYASGHIKLLLAVPLQEEEYNYTTTSTRYKLAPKTEVDFIRDVEARKKVQEFTPTGIKTVEYQAVLDNTEDIQAEKEAFDAEVRKPFSSERE